MTIQDDIQADKGAVGQAQITLEAAIAKLASDHARLTSLQRHLTLWQEVEAHACKWGGEVQTELSSIVSKALTVLGV